jgi:uncharacterized cupredoxin-like copper-binding protein
MIPLKPLTLAVVLAAFAPFVIADEGKAHGSASVADIGQPGIASEVTRTVEITLHDIYYEPAVVEVESGETVRFVLKNAGELLHEFHISTGHMDEEHQARMLQMLEQGLLSPTGINNEMAEMEPRAGTEHPDLKHGPNSLLIEPGDTAELIWTFSGDAKLEYACNMPKHKDAGMVGQIKQH